MKLSVLTLVALATFFSTHAQNIRWNNAPTTGFVFQITNDEAEKLLAKSSPDTIINSFLHTEVDTFNVNKGWTNRPSKGHFILARIIENKLHCEYTSVFPYQVLLLREYNALSLQVLDLEGNVRENARVKFRTRRIRFDLESKTYRIENEWFRGTSRIVTVELDGFRSIFNIEKHEVPSWSNDYYNYDDGPDFYSYMITDKNKYKPGERVRFKSYALTGARIPIRKELEVWLMNSSRWIKINTISPHRPGSFAGEFHLHDSLKMILDQQYTLNLRDKKGRIVSSGSFKYEDYELNGNKLVIELEKSRHYYPESNRVKINAYNENGLPLKDARAEVIILTGNIQETFQPLIVLPDTLMRRGISLNDEGEGNVDIPASLFQKSNTNYYVHVVLLNSQNQQLEKSAMASHFYSQYEFNVSYSNDSIVYQLLDNGIARQNVPVKMYRDGATQALDVTLPHKEKINPATRIVRIQSDIASRTIDLGHLLPKIQFEGGIQKDSFNISIINPQKIQVSWYIYQGSALLQKGFGDEIDFKSKIADRTQTYYAELLYSFGGVDRIISKEFEFRQGSLDIDINLPDKIYPGQKTDAIISVTDDEGTPVSGVDLTVVATTAKLNYYLPDLPYYGSTSQSRSQKATYSKRDLSKRTAILDLDYARWQKRARLDTMKYYQFTYPDRKLFSHEVPIADSTQFSFYVMKNGVAKKVHVIEVDRVPVYYAWTNNAKAYSFYADPKKYTQVTLRLHDRVLIIDSLRFTPEKKTILSIDFDHLPEEVRTHKFDPQVRGKRKRKRTKWVFTQTEINRHNNYVAIFEGTREPSYLEGDGRFVAVSAGETRQSQVLTGPIAPGMVTYSEHDRISTTYKHSGGYSYVFEDNIVYKKDARDLLPTELNDLSLRPILSINDVVINKKILLTKGPAVLPASHPDIVDLIDNNCRLKIFLPKEVELSGVASLLFLNPVTHMVISPCRTSGSSPQYILPRGLHHIIVLYNNGNYLKVDSVLLRSYSTVVADMRSKNPHPADDLSRTWKHSVISNCLSSASVPGASRTYTLQQKRFATGNVHGTIYDPTNTPIPGVTILIKGTDKGTVTDVNGQFALDVYEDPTILVISFIGYVTQEIAVAPGSEISLVMQDDVAQLSEVVVVGYGVTEKRALTYSLSTVLSGRVAGVNISSQDKNSDEPEVTGEAVERKEAEQRLYQELLTLKEIRSHFSDVAIWEPRLFTDRHGKSSFTVTFPDDITRWNLVVYGMNRQLKTGTSRKSIKSYKPLMAELHVPRFLVVGDSADLLGKVLNYSSDKTITGRTKWTASTTSDHAVTFDGYHTEMFSVVPASTDSLTASYSFTRDDGYFDGEERKVPVIAQGTLRANGTLSVLENGSEIHAQAKQGERVKIEIIDNPLYVYAGDVDYLLHYKYDCNEQLASKLIGLLNHKLLVAYEGKEFNYDKDVNKIIQRLLKNQNEEFLWSWWDVSPNTSYWMSAHILRALKLAKDAGYTVNLNIENLTRKATYKFNFLEHISVSDIQIIHALANWNAAIDYARYVTMLDKKVQYDDSVARANERRGYMYYSRLNEKLLLLEIRQLQNLPFVRDSLLQYKKQTLLNEVYFDDGAPSYYWHTDELSSNAIAYRIVKRDSLLNYMRTSMQMYFLSARRKGSWNTYQASNVLMSILPDLISTGSSKKVPAGVSLSGKVNRRIEKFPYSLELTDGESLHIRKESGVPLFYMQYTEERVTKAYSGTDGFTIKTAFDEKTLKAGKPVILTATVEVKDDANLEHVMLEIPVPAGCSYGNKHQVHSRVETHREYFKEKTLVFCENMRPGTYTFEVELLPRFTGSYSVNPAQVSLMYFPVVNANTDMERVWIR